MLSHGIRQLVVLNDRHSILGLVTLDDAIRAMSSDWACVAGILRGQAAEGLGGNPLFVR
ncbi:hypothetical protein [Cupriavidus sp. H39]|uniref:hypothetical protein n=1 Tax=Cupriavidus sp. H39 TaxID=3401635 RepID=UPI003D044544